MLLYKTYSNVNKPDGQLVPLDRRLLFPSMPGFFLSEVEPPPLSSLLFQRARKYIEKQDAPEI
jgi:hypothetical protein